MSARSSSLGEVLRRVLLVGAPVASLGCGVAASCPEDGVEPPRVFTEAVDARLADGGPLTAAQCLTVCLPNGSELITCVRESAVEVVCVVHPSPCEGRRPAGLLQRSVVPTGELERHLSEAARLEAASVEAFRILRRELAFHGAPRGLLRAASRARRDERRHSRIATAVARRFGVAAAPAEVAPRAIRPLEEVAVENAVEGCVRETWGALVALRQSARAADPVIRSAMQRIARDEIRHAELAWRVNTWIVQRLSPSARERVRRSRASAVGALSAEVTSCVGAGHALLGVPGAAESAVLLGELNRVLWRAGPLPADSSIDRRLIS